MFRVRLVRVLVNLVLMVPPPRVGLRVVPLALLVLVVLRVRLVVAVRGVLVARVAFRVNLVPVVRVVQRVRLRARVVPVVKVV
jgi:hypothetical protein